MRDLSISVLERDKIDEFMEIKDWSCDGAADEIDV